MDDWTVISVDLGEFGTVDVECRYDDTALHIQGLPNTGFDSYKMSGPRNGDTVEQQVGDTIRWWFENIKR